MSDNPAHNQNIDYENVSKIVTEMSNFMQAMDDIDVGTDERILEMSRSATDRVNTRVRPEHKHTLDQYKSGLSTNSREIIFGLALEFTRHNQDAFAEFISSYILHDMKDELVPRDEKTEEDFIEDIEDTDESTPDIEDQEEDDGEESDATPEGGTEDDESSSTPEDDEPDSSPTEEHKIPSPRENDRGGW